MYNGSSYDRGCFMKNFRFDTICNITQELLRFNCDWGFIVKSVVIKYHQLLSNVLKYKIVERPYKIDSSLTTCLTTCFLGWNNTLNKKNLLTHFVYTWVGFYPTVTLSHLKIGSELYTNYKSSKYFVIIPKNDPLEVIMTLLWVKYQLVL